MRLTRDFGRRGWWTTWAATLLAVGVALAVARAPAKAAEPDPGAAPSGDREALLKRITELSRDPQPDAWMRGEAYRQLILRRRREQTAKIDESLKRFPDTPARDDLLEYKMESLFVISVLMQKPPTELKALVEEVLAGTPGRSLEGTAWFWKIRVELHEKASAGAGEEELLALQTERFIRLAEAYPDNKNFGEVVLANMIQVSLLDGRMDQAKAYYRTLKKYHPDSEMIEPLAGELSKRQALSKPFELKFTDVRGREVDFSKMKGKVVLVEFWASWCIPCVMSVPELKRVYNKYHDQGFEIVGINLDTQRQQFEGFLRAQRISWPQYFDGKGWVSPLVRKYGVVAVPTMFLVDKKGVLRSMDVHGRLEGEVARLLAE